MQLTLNDNRLMEISNISGEEAVEIAIRRTNVEGEIVGGVVASSVSTKRCRAIGAAIIAFADAADAAFEVEDLSDAYSVPGDEPDGD